MIRTVLRAVVVAALAVAASPAAADQGAPLATLAHGEFKAELSPGTKMTCTGYPLRTCTHTWDATSCFEAAADTTVGSLGCDVYTVGTTNRTRGTAHFQSGVGYLCTTTNFGTILQVKVLVHSTFFQPDTEVNLTVAQTNGVGTFEGSRPLGSRTIIVKGTFATPGDPKGGPCGAFAQPGSFKGEYEITTPI